jgi:D-alanyl-D-alanine dipeptidase
MVPQTLILIDDPKVLAIPIVDNGDPLCDLRVRGTVKVDEHQTAPLIQLPYLAFCRLGVAERLEKAQGLLPDGIRLLIKECYRPLAIQKRAFENYLHRLTIQFPEWSAEQLHDEACQFIAPPEGVPPHSTGGAVDLTLIDRAGRELDMGTIYDAIPVETDHATSTLSPRISAPARANRDCLIEVMSAAGFVNYPTEWWHWSYGDRYWAYHRQTESCYGSVVQL